MNLFRPLLFVILPFSGGPSVVRAAPIRWSPAVNHRSIAEALQEVPQVEIRNDWTEAETGRFGSSFSFELPDLTIGHCYQVRIAPADSHRDCPVAPQRFGDGEVTENFSVYLPIGGLATVVGEFVADAEFQRLTINYHPDFEQTKAAVGGVQWRDLGPAEDSDRDGITDLLEDLHPLLDKLNPADAALDSDGDGLTNREEIQKGTDPNLLDTDGDGLTDGDEVYGLRNPFLDGALVGAPGLPTDPLSSDSDRDGLTDWQEVRGDLNQSAPRSPTDPNSPDTDGDDFSDRTEILLRADPTDPFSQPAGHLQARRTGSLRHPNIFRGIRYCGAHG